MSKGQFGEPWKAGNVVEGELYNSERVTDSKGNQVARFDGCSVGGLTHAEKMRITANREPLARVSRAIECVNALDGLNPEAVPELVKSAQAMLKMYKRGHDSGDWGSWDLEKDYEYVALRDVLAKIEQPPARQG